MHCSKCGKELGPEDILCPGCGTRAVAGPPDGEGAEKAEPGGPDVQKGMPEPPRPPAFAPQASPARVRPKTSGLAVASLVLGICGFLCVPLIGSVLAIVFGVISRKNIKQSEGRLGGAGLATAGLALGIISTALIVAWAAVWIPLAVTNVGPTRTTSETVQLQGAKTVDATLDMSRGKMKVRGGAADLLEADFTYNVKKWEPEVRYDVSDGTGELTVEQSGGWLPTLWNTRNEWDIRLNDKVPMDLAVKTSSGSSELDLGGLSLLGLNIDSSSGGVSASLSGDMPDLKKVETNVSSGSVTLRLNGRYSSPMELGAKCSSGNINLDLLGEWRANLVATVKVSSGNINLDVPDDVGVYVTANTSSGNINASGMELRGDDYTNDVYGESKVILRITVSASSGNINIRPKSGSSSSNR